MSRAVVVGSGPGGSTAAMAMARAGWDVVVFEKGVSYFTDLDTSLPGTLYSNDELKMKRGFGWASPELEPRTFRFTAEQDEPVLTGEVNNLPSAVGGGTTQWDAKVPRFWDIDFKKASMLGPVEGADIVDWPFAYEEIAPYYEVIEDLVGVSGDVDAMAEGPTLRHAPRSKPFPMGPNPTMRSAALLSEGARAVGLHPFPFMEMINSEVYDGRPPCINCGHCSHFGCPIHDRGSALVPLRHALRTGRVELRTEAMVTRIDHDGQRATGVRWIDREGVEQREDADFVVLAAGAVDSTRLALLSEVPDPGGLLGRGLMYHWFSAGYGMFLDQRVHGNRGRDAAGAFDDFCDPEFPGAAEAAQAAGLPYLRGGVVELGGTTHLLDEAAQYVDLMDIYDADKPFGSVFKQYMRYSPLRDRMAGLEMIAEDLNQPTNRVELDADVTDRFGLPVPKITYNPHTHELAAQDFFFPRIIELVKAAGADRAGIVAESSSIDRAALTGNVAPIGLHVMGGLRMGAAAETSVTDDHGRLWGLENVAVADGGVFPTSGAHNPTLTIFATSLRNAWEWGGGAGMPTVATLRGEDDAASSTTPGTDSGSDGGGVPAAAVVGGAAVVAVAAGATVAARRKASG